LILTPLDGPPGKGMHPPKCGRERLRSCLATTGNHVATAAPAVGSSAARQILKAGSETPVAESGDVEIGPDPLRSRAAPGSPDGRAT